MYRNTSQLPIREVNVQLRSPNLNGGMNYPFLPPTAAPVILPEASARLNEHIVSHPEITRNTIFSLMLPTPTGPVRATSFGEGLRVIGEIRPVRVEITFKDAEGRLWNRNIEGSLDEKKPADIQGGGVINEQSAAFLSSLDQKIRHTGEQASRTPEAGQAGESTQSGSES